jgi:PAS domain S-box-containing protein
MNESFDNPGAGLPEAALLRQKAELEAIFDLVPAQIWIKDTRNRFLRVNRQVCSDLGLAPEAIVGHSAEEIFPAMAKAYFADDQEVFRTGQPKLGIVEQVVSGAGEPRWVRTDKLPMLDGHGAVVGLLAFIQDITEVKRLQNERQRMEQEIVHAQKLESMGYLAGGLAHDMNNVLAAILGVTSALQMQYGHDASLVKGLDTILHAGKQAFIQKLQARGAVVAFVGDGVNDGPALAQADAGISLPGLEAAQAAAPLNLLREGLEPLLQARRLALRTRRVIRENLAWAFAYNLVLVPLAAFNLLERFGGPMLAGAAMGLSSLTVVVNALRLRR